MTDKTELAMTGREALALAAQMARENITGALVDVGMTLEVAQAINAEWTADRERIAILTTERDALKAECQTLRNYGVTAGKQIELLQEAVDYYGDKVRMSFCAKPELQHTIDTAIAARRALEDRHD